MDLPIENDVIKACCSRLYESNWAQFLLGDSFHPGGLVLTKLLGSFLGLKSGSRLLDVAAGKGSSAICLAGLFGCQVMGVEYSLKNVEAARSAAEAAGMADRVIFKMGDAESLPFEDGEFDALICECAFCTFPDKAAAAVEFGRVLRPGGRMGLSDVTRTGSLPARLEGLLAWIACLGDARPVVGYTDFLVKAGLLIEAVENHDEALVEMIEAIRSKLLGAELLVKLNKLDLPGVDFEKAGQFARSASKAVGNGELGYSIIIGRKPLA